MTTKRKYHQREDLEFVLKSIEQVSQTESLFDHNRPFVYGGYVRDKLRDQPFEDMDISVPCLEVARKWIEFLEQSSRIISLETKMFNDSDIPGVDYQSFSLVIQTPRTAALKIDITYSHASVLEENGLAACDFTANNLMEDSQGRLQTRIKAAQIGRGKEFSESAWTAKCIRDCMKGELVWMIPNRFSKMLSASARNTFMEKMNMRLDKMLKKGFVETGEHLTSFRLLKLRPVSTLLADADANVCAVCHENYNETPELPTVVSKCSHHFHEECIQKWMNKKNEECPQEPNCPCCRQEIVLYY
jgi:hypothetical protein